MNDSRKLLEIRNLTVDYTVGDVSNRALSDINLTLGEKEVLCLVGESGCGKSTLGLAIMGLLPSTAQVRNGAVEFENENLLNISKDSLRKIRGKKIAMIFQDPMTTLNPVESVNQHMFELLRDHDVVIDKAEATALIDSTLTSVGIGLDRIRSFPHQLSGGMRQRVMIALAILLNPTMIIADEPTTSLDVLVEAQILDTFNELRREKNLSMIFITHNFGVVAQIADRVAVMYAGEIVEVGGVLQIFDNPAHPYTEGLMKSAPNIEDIHRKIVPLIGSPPNSMKDEDACTFVNRCPYAFKRCSDEKPRLKQLVDGRSVSCHLR